MRLRQVFGSRSRPASSLAVFVLIRAYVAWVARTERVCFGPGARRSPGIQTS